MMKRMKKAAVLALAAAVLVMTAGCGAAKRSGQIKLNYQELVPEVCDYKKIPVTVTSDYTVTDKQVEDMIARVILSYGLTKEVKDRDTVEKTDMVLVDYTGYLDGEAFDRGAAKNVMIIVDQNADTSGTTFIKGFSDGLVGAKVGTKVSSKVTFPENYGNEDLAGKETVFEFDVKSIHEPLPYQELTGEQIEKLFTGYNIKTTDQMLDFVRGYLKASVESQLYNVKIAGIRKYMLENCTVKMPEEYLKLRIQEYERSMEEDFCSEGQSLKDFITSNYDMTYEEAVAEWTEYMEEQVKLELILCRIAELEKITIDEDGFSDYIKNFVTSQNYDFATEEEVYKYFGSGKANEGKTYLRQLYLVNKTLDAMIDYVEIESDVKEEK